MTKPIVHAPTAANGSTVARDIRDRFADYVHVKDFGAVGDGTTDDTVALTNALAVGGKVLFEAGKTYKITAKLFVGHGDIDIDLNGSTIYASNGDSVHLFPNNSTAQNYTGYNGLKNIRIHNGTFDGGGLVTFHNKNVYVYDMTFMNVKKGSHHIQVYAVQNMHIHDCYFEGLSDTSTNPHYESINIDPADRTASTRVFAEGSVCYDGTKNKYIYIDNCTIVKGSGTYAHLDAGIGVHYDDGAGNLHYGVHISNCHIKGTDAVCIRLNACEHSSVTNCYLETNKHGLATGYQNIRTNNIVFTNNKIVQVYSQNSVNPVAIGQFRTDDLVLYGNTYKDSGGSHKKTEWFYLATKSNSVPDLTFARLQECRVNVTDTVSENSTVITSPIPITSTNKLSMYIGTINASTFQKLTIESYYERNFQVGETYPCITTTGVVFNVNITSDYVLSIDNTTWTFREITLEAWT